MGTCPSRNRHRTNVGINSPAQSTRAKRHWRMVVKEINRLLRLRKRWAALGRFLQGTQIQNLMKGLERKQGKLVRHLKFTS